MFNVVNLGYLLSIINSNQLIKISKLDEFGDMLLYEGKAAPALSVHRFDDMWVSYIYVRDQYLNIIV